MRKLYLVAFASLFVAACTESPTGPTSPVESPTVRLSHIGSTPGMSTSSDLCGGLSPCDAYDYDRDGDGFPDGITGVPGFCLLPPMVDNHLSDPACSGDFVSGLSGQFKLAWCQVQYPTVGGQLDGSQPPTIVACQDSTQWQPLVEDPKGGEFYTASIQFKSKKDEDRTFRLYVVRGDVHFAQRDIIVDPNLTTPADAFLHAIGHGTEPAKVRITKSFTCAYYDTQSNDPNNAATCLIAGETDFPLSAGQVDTNFHFPDGNPSFIANFEISECETLRDGSGVPLVDVPLAGCKISVDSPINVLDVAAQLWVDVDDPRWSPGGPFANSRPNVLQYDEFGVRALPTADPLAWYTTPMGSNTLLRWLDRGFDKLASLFVPEPLYALPALSFNLTTMSDFMVAVMPEMHADGSLSGSACQSGLPSCLDLGTTGQSVPVAVHVEAPQAEIAPDLFDVPYTRLHYFPRHGSVACPATPTPGEICVPAGQPDSSTNPPSTWDHLVVITGSSGRGTADWTPAGEDTLDVSACGVARPGANEPNPSGEPGLDGVWGTRGECTNRYAATMDASAYDNGPADGFTPFEPVDTSNEVAIYGLPLTFVASSCPQIVVDGQKGDDNGTPEWEACATKTGFIAPLQGPKSSTDNAWLYTYNDDNTLYVALEVATNELGNKIFINFAEQANGTQDAPGDELLVIDFGDPSVDHDWHYTEACVGNNSSSLCGDPDANGDGTTYMVQAVATVGGAGASHDHVFYEFSRPLRSPNDGTGTTPKEDLLAVSDQQIGILVHVTQGQGGGKGGFEYPDPQTSPVKYYPYTLN